MRDGLHAALVGAEQDQARGMDCAGLLLTLRCDRTTEARCAPLRRHTEACLPHGVERSYPPPLCGREALGMTDSGRWCRDSIGF